jgi:hypothetical protein
VYFYEPARNPRISRETIGKLGAAEGGLLEGCSRGVIGSDKLSTGFTRQGGWLHAVFCMLETELYKGIFGRWIGAGWDRHWLVTTGFGFGYVLFLDTTIIIYFPQRMSSSRKANVMKNADLEERTVQSPLHC